MDKRVENPYIFPQEFPMPEKKYGNAVIVDGEDGEKTFFPPTLDPIDDSDVNFIPDIPMNH